MKHYEFAVIGGGMVGSAIALGLSSAGHKVVILDGGDVAHRAARGNFGLTWVQGKGLGMPDYSNWSRNSSEMWPALAEELEDMTGIDVQYQGGGGVHVCLTETELRQRKTQLRQLSRETGGKFTFKMLDHQELSELIPVIGNDVAGGSWCPNDGHTNPLLLLRALQSAIQKLGGEYIPNVTIEHIRGNAADYQLVGNSHSVSAARVVLAAGLGNLALGKQVGLDAPLAANRGQVLITERVGPMLNLPTTYVRQTGDGTIQLGDSHEDVGLDDGTVTDVLADIARRGLRKFPCLRSVRVVRGWGCLRVMTADGFPIYAQSDTHPGVFLACCHSGVTLAAAHAKRLAGWIAGGEQPLETYHFNLERFNVQAHANS